LGLSVGELSSSDPGYTQADALGWMQKALTGEPQIFDWRAKTKAGEIFWAEINMRAAAIDEEQQVIVSVRDIRERKEIEQQSQINLARSQGLTRAAAALNQSHSPEMIFETIIDFIADVLPYDVCDLLLVEGDQARPVWGVDRRGDQRRVDRWHERPPFRISETPDFHAMAATRDVYIIDDTRVQDGWVEVPERAWVRATAGVPLFDGDHLNGFIIAASSEPGRFQLNESKYLNTLADLAGVSLTKARLLSIEKEHASELEKAISERTAELNQRVSEVDVLNRAMLGMTEDLQLAVDKAQSADRLKSAFLATMSHELRTPLNSIIGFTGLMLQGLTGELAPEQSKQLGMVQTSARHLLNLINDVLDISKIEAGQLDVSRNLFDMRALIDKVVGTVTPLAGEKGLALTYHVAQGVGQIVSDQRRVDQVLINLVNNAIKFTDEGEVRIECETKNGWLITRVIDTGLGIKPEDVQQLFTAFRQVETGINRQYEGTGLGLSISKKLIKLLSGEIWVESLWGEGSTFGFSLPLERKADD
jgi:signal transduction histidine kinase